MAMGISEQDIAILKVCDKRYIGTLPAILAHVQDNLYKLGETGVPEEFTLKVPRPDFEYAPHRVKFSRAPLSLLVGDVHYHQYTADTVNGGMLEQNLTNYLKNLSRVSEVKDTPGRLYRL
jgi:hypothetical protein